MDDKSNKTDAEKLRALRTEYDRADADPGLLPPSARMRPLNNVACGDPVEGGQVHPESAMPSRPVASSAQFYLQDSRDYVGNDVLWWAKDGKGYTTDLSKAQIYTKAEAVSQHESRETDIPWPKAYIDAKTRPAVDMQYIKRDEALAGTGIVLRKPAKPKRDTTNCHGCGRFINDVQRYSSDCEHCGADNRP